MVISAFMLVGYKDCLYFSSAETFIKNPVVSSVYKFPEVKASHSVFHADKFMGY